MTPAEALDRVVYLLDRAHQGGHRVNAFIRAKRVIADLSADELAARAADGTLTKLPGIGDTTARVIVEALAGEVPAYLAKLEADTVVAPTDAGAEAVRAALRGDCHSHTTWSDGGAELPVMVETARGLGHEYLVITDHSPRLTVAHGLNRERLEAQLDVIEALNAELAPTGFRVLRGMEVDILEDGALDLDEDLLDRLDLVVASVHSKLRMGSAAMTERMLLAVANPHVDVLGHCTGRLIGKRPESSFDAEYVFAACAQFHTAVEINCRPERLDPPRALLDLALEHGCWFSIDTDAHAPGQLEWQVHGCERAAERGVPTERIINAMGADDLLAWTAETAAA